MGFKYNVTMLKKLEEVFKEGGYTVRYERGNFQNGFCILEKRRVVVINRFHEPEGKINSMIEILSTIEDLELENLSSESQELLQQIKMEKETLFKISG
ncbi:MAG: hypothetical protein IPP77_12920 [Bacteroidetes bacterium]|nr:hypothetical protein [Bacteroidota bacterium]